MRGPFLSFRHALLASAVVVVCAGCPEKTSSTLPPSGIAGSHANVDKGSANPSLGSAPHNASAKAAPSSLPAGHAPTGDAKVIRGDRPGAPSAKGTGHKGVVLEAMNSAGYTYIKFKTEDGIEKWAAVTETKVAVGQKVSISESMIMRDFTSKTLKRTFKSIIFGSLN